MKITPHKNGLIITGAIDFNVLRKVEQFSTESYKVINPTRIEWYGLFGMAPILKEEIERLSKQSVPVDTPALA